MSGLEYGDLDGEPTVLLRRDGARLEVALKGATVLRWAVPGSEGGQQVELAAGYDSAAALERNKEGAFAVMAPYANRIRGGQYTFAGEEHDLRPSMHPADPEVIHGLVRRAPWRVEGHGEDEDGAHLALSTTVRADEHPGYPFDLDLQVTFRLTEHRLGVAMRVTNVGTTVAPVVVGWHPYFALPGHETIDGLTVNVPAQTRVLVDDALIPLPGDEAYQPLPDGLRLEPVGDTRLDASFLLAETEGTASTWLRSPVTGRAVEIRQRPEQAPVMHIFTGDTLEGRERTVIALEPVGGIADAYNRPEWADRVELAPGATRDLDVEVVYHPDA